MSKHSSENFLAVRCLQLFQWQTGVSEDLLSPGVLSSRVVTAPDLPLGGQQALHPHGAPGVNTTGGDTHLGPQT